MSAQDTSDAVAQNPQAEVVPRGLQLSFTVPWYAFEVARIGKASALAIALGCAASLGCRPVDPHPDEGVDLSDAIEVAQDDVRDGVPVDAELTEFEGEPAYDVDLFLDGETREIFVDAESGEVVGRLVDPDDFADGAAAAEALVASDISLLEAIEIAQDAVDGEAVAAELDETLTAIEIVLLMDTDTRVVSVSLADGSATVD